MSDCLQSHELQHTRIFCPPLSPGAYPNSSLLSWCWYLTISFSAIPFSFCLQSFPALGSFPRSRLFPSGGHSIGVSASPSVLPMNSQGSSPLGWTGLISLLSKGLLRVFSNTTVQKHQFFSTQPSLWSNSHVTTGKTIALTSWTFVGVWYFHLFKIFPWFVVIHTVKGFSSVNDAEVDFFLNPLAFSVMQGMWSI